MSDMRRLINLMEETDREVTVIDRDEVEDERNVEPPKRHMVVLHNDDYTPAELVVHVLQKHFRLNNDAAMQVMLKVHQDGQGVIATFPKDIAETKATLATQEGRALGYPLLFTAEPE